jgi:hypothetical protein
MSRKTLLLLVAVVLLLGSGVYYWTAVRAQASAEDCGDKPKPKSDFAMAAECDGGTAPAPAQPAPR